ncbi:hypothetical protein HNQ88_005002 [Aureibacter tunicatorum]|uniref:Uncharacterized protein n=1 Tax=Aureibacter tunicatorum TaxID=866807 RepID=A0AAE4BVB6_9BACT|nr:hypothetical protein [Aureibacter tunicatorum]BDD07464.1 hypothetical protein AUTU_49470 [Aureibacter tunicatorum]
MSKKTPLKHEPLSLLEIKDLHNFKELNILFIKKESTHIT